MSPGKARNILFNDILLALVQETNQDKCFHCNKFIDNVNELSIEHKIPWMDTSNPSDLYFNLNNIAFSHKICNSRNAQTIKPSNNDTIGKNKNDKIKEQLGIPYGTARNKLRAKILFHLVSVTNRQECFQCGLDIEVSSELSIEHKIAWRNSDNPKSLFFNLNNIDFSHRSCNSSNNDRERLKNNAIKRLKPNQVTGYLGVTLEKRHSINAYVARIQHNGKRIYIGQSKDNPKKLAEMYDQKAIELRGSDTVTNKSLGLLD